MLKRYLGEIYEPESNSVIEQKLIGKPRIFVRELSFTAKLRAASAGDANLKGHLKTTLRALEKQVLDGEAFLHEDKPALGFGQREKVQDDEFATATPL